MTLKRTYKPDPNARVAPTDAECSTAWAQIMTIAEKHCLILQAYGGVATLAIPEEQRKAGVRETVLYAHVAREP